MKKINETLSVIKAGARNNKYRVLYPNFGKDIDIVCNATSSPGRELGTTEVFVKGRKYILAAEMADEGTWEMTIYNTPDLFHRRFFLKLLGGVHNFNTPGYLYDGGGNSSLSAGAFSPFSVGGKGSSSGISDLGSALNGIDYTINEINSVYDGIKGSVNQFENAIVGASDRIDALFNSQNTSSVGGNQGYGSMPWYQHEIIIQQLNHEDEVISETILFNAFVTGVGAIEYSDEIGEISTSTISFAYSAAEYGNYSQLNTLEIY